LPCARPHVAQRLVEILGLDVLVALDGEAADRRALLHHHHEHTWILAAHLDVAEKAHRVHRAQRLAHALRIEAVADVHRQCVEKCAFGDALQSLDADAGHREGAVRG
jgi:hypothetical protein